MYIVTNNYILCSVFTITEA